MSTPVSFFSIPLHRLSHAQKEALLEESLDSVGTSMIATVNPEMLVAAKGSAEIRDVLSDMHWRIPDGVGISFLSVLTGQGKIQRFPGVELLLDVCRAAAPRSLHLVLVGGRHGATEKCAKILMAAFPGLTVTPVGDVEVDLIEGNWVQSDGLVEGVQSLTPDIIAVALGGAGYSRQERWIRDHARAFPTAKLMMGVGGSIDMIAGVIPRAPEWMSSAGLEWLWRLRQEPSRYGRILTAVVLFPALALWDRVVSNSTNQ